MTLRGKRPSMHQTLYLTDDTRLVATSNLPDVRNVFCHADQRCQSLLQGDVMAGWIRFIALKIQTQGSAFGPGTGEAEDCAGAVIEDDPDTLFFNRDLSIEGDTELGLVVKNMLDAVEWPKMSGFPCFRHSA